MSDTAIVWFRRDLRLADNPALNMALERHARIIPLYIHAPHEQDAWMPGAASRWWLHHSLLSLDQSLKQRGSHLVVRTADTCLDVLQALIAESGATHVYWNRLYEPHAMKRDRQITTTLIEAGIQVSTCNASLLFEPEEIAKQDGTPYRVFTPFWKACLRQETPFALTDSPARLPAVSQGIATVKIETLALLPSIRWDSGLASSWQPGESAAEVCLDSFLDDAVSVYPTGRDRPDRQHTSRLSPHLHFGEISPQRVVSRARQFAAAQSMPGLVTGTDAFIREVGWREFASHLLYHFPHTTDKPLYGHFEQFPWRTEYTGDLEAWQRGQTGIPVVDAGMRELWHTGWMHNRVRMIVASLLTKNLLIPWQAGARWFWDTLVDADLASNTLGWQWTAGCGADAAPYFRIFNPVTQANRFDPQGYYIRRWIPELAGLPDRYLASPWTAPDTVLATAGVRLAKDYPAPLVDLKVSRAAALERYQSIKNLPRKTPE